jgi:hypothetical protein
VQRVKPKARARIRASERSRARVSFIVLQKSKSCVWHRGSASTVKSGAGVHGCLGRCRSLRPTSGANVAVEGTQGDVIVAAKPRHASSSLEGHRKGLRGCGVGPRPGVERKLASMKGALDRGRGGPSRGFRTKRSRIRRRSSRIPRRGAADSLRIDRGVRDSIGARCARKKKRLVPAPARSVSARSRVVKRGAAR